MEFEPKSAFKADVLNHFTMSKLLTLLTSKCHLCASLVICHYFKWWLVGQIQPAPLSLEIKFYWGAAVFMHLHTDSAFGCFCAERKSWVVAAEIAWPAKPNICAFWSLQRSLRTRLTPSCNVHVSTLAAQVSILGFRESRELALPTSKELEPPKHWGLECQNAFVPPDAYRATTFLFTSCRGILWHVANGMVFSAAHWC